MLGQQVWTDLCRTQGGWAETKPAFSPSAQQMLWPRDVFFGGNRGCANRLDAQLLRALAYAQYGLPVPSITTDANATAGAGNAAGAAPSTKEAASDSSGRHHPAAPAEHAEPVQQSPAGASLPALPPGQTLRILLQRKSANRRLMNEAEVVQVLHEFGEVRPQAVPLQGPIAGSCLRCWLWGARGACG